MSYESIRYVADSGIAYQVNVPADFALALGQTAATAEPSLPVEVAPRYANFQTVAGVWRQAVIDTQANFAAVIGTTVTVGGVSFKAKSARGESTPQAAAVTVNGAYLLQGPKGDAGISPIVAGYQDAGGGFIDFVSPQTDTNVANLALPAGKFLLSFAASIQNLGPGESAVLYLSSGAGVKAKAFCVATDPTQAFPMAGSGLVELLAPATMGLWLTSTSGCRVWLSASAYVGPDIVALQYG